MKVILFPHNKLLVKNKESIYIYDTDKDEFFKKKVIDVVSFILNDFRYSNITISCHTNDGKKVSILPDIGKIQTNRYHSRIHAVEFSMIDIYVGCDIEISSNGSDIKACLCNPDFRGAFPRNEGGNFYSCLAGKYGRIICFGGKALLLNSADIKDEFNLHSYSPDGIFFSYDGKVLGINAIFQSDVVNYVISSEFKADVPSTIKFGGSLKEDVRPLLKEIPQELKRRYILTGRYI